MGNALAKLEDLLFGSENPMRKGCDKEEMYYRKYLATTNGLDMIDNVYEVHFKPSLMFSTKLKYFKRKMSTEMSIFLDQAVEAIDACNDPDQKVNLLLHYDDEIHKVIEDVRFYIQMNPIKIEKFNDEQFDFLGNERAYEVCYIFNMAACYLVQVGMELQNKYERLNGDDLMSIDEYYLSAVGRKQNNIVWVDQVKDVEPTESLHQNGYAYYFVNLKKDNESIPSFYNYCIQNKLISADTTLNAFKAVFSGRTVHAKIVWIGPKHLLALSIKHWIDRKILTTVPKGTGHWVVASHCFVDVDGNSFKDLGSETPRDYTANLLNGLIACLDPQALTVPFTLKR